MSAAPSRAAGPTASRCRRAGEQSHLEPSSSAAPAALSRPTSAPSFATPIRWASSCSPATSRRPSRRAAWSTICRSSVARADAPVLIDQEGGRVARLRPPHWRSAPPARLLGELYARDPEGGLEAASLNSRLLAADLASIGADVDCLPVLDLAFPETHAVIGDRAYADAARGRRRPGPRRGRGASGRGRDAGDEAHARPWSRHASTAMSACRESTRRATSWSAPTSCRFASCPTCRGRMTAHLLFAAIDASHASHGIGTGREGGHPRPYRLRGPAAVRRPLHAGAGRHAGRARGARAGGGLRPRPALQWPDGRDDRDRRARRRR